MKRIYVMNAGKDFPARTIWTNIKRLTSTGNRLFNVQIVRRSLLHPANWGCTVMCIATINTCAIFAIPSIYQLWDIDLIWVSIYTFKSLHNNCNSNNNVRKINILGTERHRRTDADRRFPCSFCSMKFFELNELKYHQAVHTAEKRKFMQFFDIFQVKYLIVVFRVSMPFLRSSIQIHWRLE